MLGLSSAGKIQGYVTLNKIGEGLVFCNNKGSVIWISQHTNASLPRVGENIYEWIKLAAGGRPAKILEDLFKDPKPYSFRILSRGREGNWGCYKFAFDGLVILQFKVGKEIETESETTLFEFLPALLEYWPGLIIEQGLDLKIKWALPSFQRYCGIELDEIHSGRISFFDLIYPDDREELKAKIENCISGSKIVETNFKLINRVTGQLFYIKEIRLPKIDHAGTLTGFMLLWQDLSKQLIAENLLMKYSCQQTVSLLITGLAHDYNNLITRVLTLTENLKARLGRESQLSKEYVNLIEENLLEASSLIRRIISLHRQEPTGQFQVEVNELIEHTVSLLRRSLPKNISIELNLSSEPLITKLEVLEFRQCLLNLVSNAVDAMPSGGKLIIESGKAFVNPQSYKLIIGQLPQSRAIYVTVKDTGAGISPEIMPYIFEPFFSTKSGPSSGTGLGLYICRMFVERHHGAITVNSCPSFGSCFTIWLKPCEIC